MTILSTAERTGQFSAPAGADDASRAQSPVTEAVFWLDGKRRFDPDGALPTEGLSAQELNERANIAREPSEWGPWRRESVMAALEASAKNLGAPQGWGWAWGAKTIFGVVGDAIHCEPAKTAQPLWPELIWALGTERNLGARVHQARLLGEKRAPLRWTGKALDEKENASNEKSRDERGLGDDFLIQEWAFKGGPEDEKKWSLTECQAMLSVWIAAGGSLSRAWTPEHPEPDSWRKENRHSLVALSLSRYDCSPDKTMALLDAGAPIEEDPQGCVSVSACWVVQEEACFPVAQRLSVMGMSFGPQPGVGEPLLGAFLGDPRTLLMVAEECSGEKGAAALNWAWRRQKEVEKMDEKPLGPTQIQRFSAFLAKCEADELSQIGGGPKAARALSGKGNRL